ncbi:hypothetical protein GCM10028796_42480 [Ramlibacter monticola]
MLALSKGEGMAWIIAAASRPLERAGKDGAASGQDPFSPAGLSAMIRALSALQPKELGNGAAPGGPSCNER